jgi:hypothetical protein
MRRTFGREAVSSSCVLCARFTISSDQETAMANVAKKGLLLPRLPSTPILRFGTAVELSISPTSA